jgi:hypothetical protein
MLLFMDTKITYEQYKSRYKNQFSWKCYGDFLNDMGERPSPQHKLKRKDTNITFCKENCYWDIPKAGQSTTQEYHIFMHIKDRCNNRNGAGYHNYGGRGIKCLWQSFDEFYKDMGNRPSPKHTIERIDNADHYYKQNCRWATRKDQARNRRDCHYLTFAGETHCIKEWAEIMNMPNETLHRRLNSGWSIKDALFAIRQTNKPHPYRR